MRVCTLAHRILVTALLTAAIIRTDISAAAPTQNPVRFGASVFGVPNGVISELMRRDQILNAELTTITGAVPQHFDFPETPPIMQLIAEGKIDVTAAADLPVLESAARGDIQVIGLVRIGHVIVVGPKGQTLGDLRGKRIGYAPGTSSHYGILQALSNTGLTEKDVTLVALSTEKIADALLGKTIDAFSLHEPIPSSLIAKYPERYEAIYRNLSYAYLVVAKSFFTRYPEAVPHIAAALARAVNWLRMNRENQVKAAEWMRASAKTLKGSEPDYTASVVVRLTRDTLLDVREAPQLPRNIRSDNSPLAREVAFMQKQGRISNNTNWTIIKTAFNSEVMQIVIDNKKQYRVDEFDYVH